jgi:hypothetical protein
MRHSTYLFHKRLFCIPASHICRVIISEQAQSLCSLSDSRVGLCRRKVFAAIKDGQIITRPNLQSHNKEMSMKLAILGILVTALIAVSPTAFAQDSSGKTSGQAMQDKSTMKASQAKKHERKTVGSKPSSPDTDNTSVPGASIDKDDTSPKSR